jgi:hypothetical protein
MSDNPLDELEHFSIEAGLGFDDEGIFDLMCQRCPNPGRVQYVLQDSHHCSLADLVNIAQGHNASVHASQTDLGPGDHE